MLKIPPGVVSLIVLYNTKRPMETRSILDVRRLVPEINIEIIQQRPVSTVVLMERLPIIIHGTALPGAMRVSLLKISIILVSRSALKICSDIKKCVFRSVPTIRCNTMITRHGYVSIAVRLIPPISQIIAQ